MIESNPLYDELKALIDKCEYGLNPWAYNMSWYQVRTCKECHETRGKPHLDSCKYGKIAELVKPRPRSSPRSR